MFASTNKKTMRNSTSKEPKKGYKRFDIFKVDNGILNYFGTYDAKKSGEVRVYLAENGFKGRYWWAVKSVWNQIEATHLI